MEYFYEITPESGHYKEYFQYRDALKEQIQMVSAFKKEHGIQEDGYAIWGGLYVHEANLPLFKGQFCTKPIADSNGNRFFRFKKNSAVGKAFEKCGIQDVRKPAVPFFFKEYYGKSQSRLFHIEDKLYCSISVLDMESKIETPHGFTPMKASAFFAIIEAEEERRKADMEINA